MKTFVQRWLMVFAAFVVVALFVLSGCTDSGVSHSTVAQRHSGLEKTTNHALYHDASIRARPAQPASAHLMQRATSQSRRLQSLDQAQRARRTVSRW